MFYSLRFFGTAEDIKSIMDRIIYVDKMLERLDCEEA